jgi:nucleoside-diphosphate-sugar epimerase
MVTEGNMKRAVITGATSMLGLALVNECIANNTYVLAIIRKNSVKRCILPKSELVTVVESDISELKCLAVDSQRSCDTFYHFAWEATGGSQRNDVLAQNRNIGYTLDAVQLAHRLGCGLFIGAGSQAEYGRVEGKISPNMNVSPDSAYGAAKYAAGKLAAIYAGQLGMECIWTRVFSTYGIHDMPSTMIMYCIDSLLKGEKPLLTKCEQQWDYLNCRDAARAFYLLGEKKKHHKIYNIGSGFTRPLSDYVHIIRDIIDPTLHLGIGECDYVPEQVMHLSPDIANLVDDTGFQPKIGFAEGIREIIEWYTTSRH